MPCPPVRLAAACALLAVAGAARAGAQDAAGGPASAAPRAVFDREVHDFGVARQETELRTEFTLTNAGAAPLHVTDVRADCGCAAATAGSREVAPGASTPIRVALRTLTASGVLSKRVFVMTDDPALPRAELKIRVEVAAGIVLDPARFFFGDVPSGTAPSRTLRVKWKEGVGRPFHLTSVEVPHADVRLDSRPFDAPPWHGYEVTATFTKPPPVGTFGAFALIRTDDPDYPRFTVALQAQVSGRVWVDRRAVSLGMVPAGKGRQTAVLCRAFTPDVDLGEVKAASRKGRVEATAVRSGKDWVVTIRLPEAAPAGPVEDVVEIRSALPDEPPAEVAVTGYVGGGTK